MDREDKYYIDLGKLGCSEENESLSIHESYEDIEITEEDLEDYLANDKYSKKLNRPTSSGPMILLRSGNIYDISSYETHPAFAGAVGGYFGYEYNEDEFEDYDSEFLDYLEEELGVITLNPGDHAFEDRLKIVCESKPTSYQLNVIRDFIDEMQTRFSSNTTLYLWVMGHSQTYELGKYTSDELIKKIRMVFVRGRLEEKYYATPNKLYNIDKDTAYWPDDAEDYIYWHSEADKWAEDYAKSYKVKMSPKEFLDLTTTNGADKLKTGDSLGLGKLRDLDVDEFNKELYQNIFLQIAFRNVDNPNVAQVVGHEGRHRMFALMQAGVKSVDVELIADVYDTEYNKYKPFKLDRITLIGQFNKNAVVTVYNPIAMSWKQHKSIRPNLKDESLTEYLDEIKDDGFGTIYHDYPVYVTDEVYRLKSMLQRADKPYRIYNLDETYYFQDATGNMTHGEMLQYAKDKGYIAGDTRISSEDSNYVYPEDEDIGYIVFIPKNFSGHIRYHTRLGDDGYQACKVYSFGNVYVRDSEEFDDGLFMALDEPERTIWYDELEGKVSITDKNNNTREFDVMDDLEGDIDNADTVNLITKELIKEDFSKSARDCLDALDRMFGQEEVYMWSTYILPNGHFLNPDNAGVYFYSIDEEPGYEHYDFEDWAYAQGYDLNDIYDNCVKMNVTYPYLSMPDKARPTNGQLMAVKKIIDNKDAFEQEEPLSDWYDIFGKDKINSMGENLLAVFTPVGDEVFDLDVSSADDIIKAINKAYVRGSFNESFQLKEDSERDTFIFDGKKAWSGAVNTLDGTIEEVHSYNDAKNYGFHHSFYFSDEQLDKMSEGDSCFFCVYKDHTIMLNATKRFNSRNDDIELRENYLINRIKEQIKFINDINEELSRDEIEDRVANELGTSSEPVEGPSYILRDGSFLKIWNSNKNIKGMSGSKSVSGKTMHLDVDGFINKKIDSDSYSYYYLNVDCIRVNTGFEEYIVLPKYRPNNAQFESLGKWLNFYFFDMKHDKLKVMDWYGSSLNTKEYYLDETMPEEIIKKIKSYYNTGELRENKGRFRVEWTTPEDSFEKSFSTYQKALDYYTDIRDGDVFWSTIEMYDVSKTPAELLAIDYKSNADIDKYLNNENLQEKIVKKGNKWQVQSEKGKNLGTYDTKKEAEDRLKQVHYFKHMNEDKEDYQKKFDERTHAHIDRVNKYAKKIDKEYPHHDEDKFNELYDGYSLMSKNKEDITKEEQAMIDDATFKHVINNEHHCEHWVDPKDIEGFSRDNPTPNGCLDCSRMPESALEEMCCDWCAMSEEFNNTPFEWYEKNKDTRWHFNEEQDKFILDTLHKLWNESLNENIHLIDKENENCYYTYSAYDVRNFIEDRLVHGAMSVIKICYYFESGIYLFADGYDCIHEMLEEMAVEQGLVEEDELSERYLVYSKDNDDIEVIDYSEGKVFAYKNFKVFDASHNQTFKKTELYNILSWPVKEFEMLNGMFIKNGKAVTSLKNESLNESKQDIEKFKQWAGEELADRFFAVKNRLEGQKKDIYYWMKLEEDTFKRMIQYDRWKDNQEQAREYAHKTAIESLEGAIEILEDTPTRKQLDKQAKEGAEKIYEDDRWLVVKINTYGASVKYGKNTQWCITGTNSQADGGIYDWKYHHESGGCDFYFYIDKKNNHKYALEYYDDKNWALYTEEDYVDVGMGWPFNSAMDALGEPWSPYEHTSYPAFPKVDGLPDLQQAYRDAIADISEDSLDANDFLAESLDNTVYYHGSSQKGLNKLTSSINWITEDKEYAKYYALALSDTAYVYTCEADLDNIFDAGRTGDNVFALMPITKPYKLSIEMKRLADRLNLSEEDAYRLVQDAISEYPQNNEYRTKISTIVRSNAFKKILQEKGYTSIHTIEYNVPEARYCDCYGILDSNDVKILSSEEVTYDAKLNDK